MAVIKKSPVNLAIDGALIDGFRSSGLD